MLFNTDVSPDLLSD